MRTRTSAVVIIATANLIALDKMLIAATSLSISAAGFLTFGILTKRIGAEPRTNKPQLLIYSILALAISVAMIFVEMKV